MHVVHQRQAFQSEVREYAVYERAKRYIMGRKSESDQGACWMCCVQSMAHTRIHANASFVSATRMNRSCCVCRNRVCSIPACALEEVFHVSSATG